MKKSFHKQFFAIVNSLGSWDLTGISIIKKFWVILQNRYRTVKLMSVILVGSNCLKFQELTLQGPHSSVSG